MDQYWRLIIAGLTMELLYLFYRLGNGSPAQIVIKYMVIYGGAFLVMMVSYRLVEEREFSRFFFVIVLGFALVFGLTLVASPPDQSDDIYRYVWDGKLQHFGISPYTYAPDDPALAKYHSETLPALVNFPHIKSIYPPVGQLLFRVSYGLFGESVTGMKLLFLLAAMGSICLFYSILKTRGSDPRWLLFFAWNPLVIMETAINGHLDILMVFFILLCLWLFYKGKTVFSGIALACAVLTKLIPIIFLPVFLLFFIYNHEEHEEHQENEGWNGVFKRILEFFVPQVLTIAVFYAFYFESASNMFLTVVNYSTKWYFNNPMFNVILAVFERNETAHVVSFSLFVLVFIVILVKVKPLEKQLFYAAGAFVLLNPTIHPWYLMILLALLCIRRNPVVVLWSGLIVISYVVVYRYKLTGVWEDSWLLMSLEYLPLLAFLIFSRFNYFSSSDIIRSGRKNNDKKI